MLGVSKVPGAIRFSSVNTRYWKLYWVAFPRPDVFCFAEIGKLMFNFCLCLLSKLITGQEKIQ